MPPGAGGRPRGGSQKCSNGGARPVNGVDVCRRAENFQRQSLERSHERDAHVGVERLSAELDGGPVNAIEDGLAELNSVGREPGIRAQGLLHQDPQQASIAPMELEVGVEKRVEGGPRRFLGRFDGIESVEESIAGQ